MHLISEISNILDEFSCASYMKLYTDTLKQSMHETLESRNYSISQYLIKFVVIVNLLSEISSKLSEFPLSHI